MGVRAREGSYAAPLVFDVLDDRGFELGGDARRLCGIADRLVFRSRTLEERFAGYGRGLSHFIPDGVDARHFLKATRSSTPVPYDSRFIRRPVLAYMGSIDERLDLKLLEKLAEETLDWNVIMVGPVSRISPESLPRLGNIYWLGPRQYEHLPNYLREVDACILPFQSTAELDGYMPGQVYEMLCAGRPVVASPLRELAERNLAGVHVARSRADFIRACHRAVAPMTAAARREIILQVVSRTWRRVSEAVRDVLLF